MKQLISGPDFIPISESGFKYTKSVPSFQLTLSSNFHKEVIYSE